jgi:GldE: gliding motility-associated protein GldE
VLYPIAKFATWLSFGLLRLFGIRVKDSDGIKSFEKVDLENLLEENTETQSEQENEIRIFQNALDFSDILVRDCMVPRVDVEAVDVESSIGEIYGRFIESQYSRIFVWDGSIDNIVGYVNIKSLFRNPASIRDIMIGVRYVPETMPAERLLEEFTKNRISVAVVIDEFGGTAGIISLEDVLEEIFGEIDDEHDTSDMVERQVAENEYVFSSRLEVKYLNEKYGLGIEESDEYETLAGYIISNENGIPPTGAEVSIGNKLIRILKSSSSRIELVKVRLL